MSCLFSFSLRIQCNNTLKPVNMPNNPTAVSLLLRRIAAFFYDCLLLIAIFFLITSIAIAFNNGQAVQHPGFYIGLYLFAFFFFDWFWRHGGQTLGMRAWRLKVEGVDGELITFKQSAMRYFSGSILFGISLLYALISTESQALHDTISKTKITRNYN
ncbi:MAG: putative RDD family membrane protein YckC [Granulosicoccus sp.]